jgi:hypothetical protein
MQVNAQIEVPGAMVVDSEAIRKIWLQAEEFCAPVVATVTCSDDLVRVFESMQMLLDYENSKRAEIKRVEFECRSRENSRFVLVSLGRQYNDSISIRLSGEEADVSAVKTKLSDTIHGMKAWYSLIAKADMAAIFSAISFFVFVTLTLMSSGQTVSKGRTLKEAAQIAPLVILILAAIFMCVFVIIKIRSRFFPSTIFTIGQGLKRYQFDEQIRWTVIVSFFVGIAGAITYGFAGGA